MIKSLRFLIFMAVWVVSGELMSYYNAEVWLAQFVGAIIGILLILTDGDIKWKKE